MQIPTPSCTSMSLVRGHNLQVVCQTADVAYETSHGRCLMSNVWCGMSVIWCLKMKKWSSQWMQFMQLRKEAWKNSGLQRGLNPWPRNTGVMLYQLSYEATDIGSNIHCDDHFFIFISIWFISYIINTYLMSVVWYSISDVWCQMADVWCLMWYVRCLL